MNNNDSILNEVASRRGGETSFVLDRTHAPGTEEFSRGVPSGPNANAHQRTAKNEQPESTEEREFGSGAALLDALRTTLSRHVVLPPHGAEMLALWILHTYGFELRDVTTYVGLVSPEKRCGKTTLLGLLALLANRPIVASNISPPALFRVIQEMKPTLLIDEADTFLQGNEEIRGILNSGYSRETAFVMRVAGSGAGQSAGEAPQEVRADRWAGLAKFSCWCPKVMAAIGRLPDTLADRCIVLTMQRKKPGERCERLRNLNPRVFREACARFVSEHAVEIQTRRPAVPDLLNDRAADIWEPLLALAELAGGDWPGMARAAAVALSAEAQESDALSALLLDVYMLLIRAEKERMFSRKLVEELNSYQEQPWDEIKTRKQFTELRLSQVLRPYGIRPRTVWIGEESARGYLADDFHEVVGRYAMPLLQQMKAEMEKEKAESQKRAAEKKRAS